MSKSIEFLILGQNIQEIRKSLHMTQDQFSEKLNITPKFVSQVETGYAGISVDNIINICKLAKCSSVNVFKGIIDFPHITDNYELLNPTNKAIAEEIITILLNSQQNPN